MARGFVAGAICGLVVSVVGAGVLSVATGPVQRVGTAPEMTGGTVSEEPAEPAVTEAVPEEPVAEPEEVAPAEPAEAPAEPEETAGAAPTAEPEPADEDPASTTPEMTEQPAIPPARRPAEESAVAAAGEGPALSAPPEAPEGSAPDTSPGTRPEAATDTGAPAMPDAPESSGARVAVTTEAPSLPGGQIAAPEAPLAEEEPSIATDPAQPPAPPVSEEQSGLAPAEDHTLSEEPDADSVQPDESEAGDEAAEAAPLPVLPEITPESEEAGNEIARPAIGTPGSSLIGRDSAVSQGRLPSVGTGETVPATEATEGETPLDRFAAEAEVPAEGPLMSVVLIDDGSGPLGPDTIEAFPFPVSFAIAPSHPDAAEAARDYRARGFEVLAMAGAPEGAQASDVEISLEGALGAVPEAIGVLEDPSSGLQSSRALAEQTAAFLEASGHGLLMLPAGLNTGEALALRAGVPTASVFRDFDGEGQDPRVMRRFLDQAAFRARQEGTVVMLGRLRADTVSALLLWGLQDRATSVTLVPVSAILKRSVGEE